MTEGFKKATCKGAPYKNIIYGHIRKWPHCDVYGIRTYRALLAQFVIGPYIAILCKDIL